MFRPLLLLLLLLTVSLVTGSSRSVLSRWDIQPGVSSSFMKDDGHEKITRLASAQLPSGSRDLLHAGPLKSGVRYNDMPGKDGDTTNLVDFLVKFTKAEADTEVEQREVLLKFLDSDKDAKRVICKAGEPNCNRKKVIVKLAKSNVEKTKAMLRLWFCNHDQRQDDAFCVAMTKVLFKYEKHKLTSVAASHIGCKQTWHAMCPVASSPRGDWFIFTQNDIVKLIKNQAIDWWKTALVMQKKFLKHSSEHAKKSSWQQLTSSEPEDLSDFTVAHLLHTIQDSWANGHALRDAKGPQGCGDIHLFMGYTMQHGTSAHGDADHDPEPESLIRGSLGPRSEFNLARRKVLFKCAVKHSSAILKAWAKCKQFARKKFTDKGSAPTIADSACAFPEAAFDDAFKVAPGRGEERAGGSILRYSSFWANTAAEIEAKTKLEQYAVRHYPLEVFTGPKQFEDCTRKSTKPDHCIMDIYDLHYFIHRKDPREIGTKPVARGAIFGEYIKKLPGKNHYTNDFVCKQLVPLEQLD